MMSELGAGPPPAEQLLTVSQRVEHGAVVVCADGEIDTLTVPRLATALATALDAALGAPPARRLIIDLTAVSFLGSAGLAVLARIAAQARRRRAGAPLRLVVDHNRPVVRPTQLTDLEDMFTLCYSLAEALTS
jgi:anti-sigma B factor antagonist